MTWQHSASKQLASWKFLLHSSTRALFPLWNTTIVLLHSDYILVEVVLLIRVNCIIMPRAKEFFEDVPWPDLLIPHTKRFCFTWSENKRQGNPKLKVDIKLWNWNIHMWVKQSVVAHHYVSLPPLWKLKRACNIDQRLLNSLYICMWRETYVNKYLVWEMHICLYQI